MLQTVLADDVYMVARKLPMGAEGRGLPTNHFLPANLFGSRLLHAKYDDPARDICGRVLLVRLSDAQSELAVGSILHSFQSYTAEEFAADVQRVSKDWGSQDFVSDMSFKFPCDKIVGSIPGSHALWLPPAETPEAVYVRMTCGGKDSDGKLHVAVEQYRRLAAVNFAGSCRYEQIRQQLARDMTWQDFGHESDWSDPSSKSHISAREGWEVGLLETTLGHGICMLARKPPGPQWWCIPPNKLAEDLMHPKHKQFVKYVHGSVLLVTAEDDLTQASLSGGAYKLGSLELAAFHAAYDKLSAEVRAGIILTTIGADGQELSPAQLSTQEPDSCSDFEALVQAEGDGNMAETIVTPVMSAMAAPDELDGWELVSGVELTYAAAS